MPIFEFVCKQCGNEFDVLVSSSKKDEIKCSACGSVQLKKKLSSFSTTSGSKEPSNDCRGCAAAQSGLCSMGE